MARIALSHYPYEAVSKAIVFRQKNLQTNVVTMGAAVVELPQIIEASACQIDIARSEKLVETGAFYLRCNGEKGRSSQLFLSLTIRSK